jgi:hypothetical protein
MTRVQTIVVLVCATIFVTAAQGVASPVGGPRVTAVACSSIGGTPKRLELADGSIVSVDMRSMAHSDGLIFAAGRHGYVFPPGVVADRIPTSIDSIVGVLIDGQQRVSPVRNPLAPMRVFHPRVVAGPNGLFHVLLATGLDTVKILPAPHDTATLWYATIQQGKWSRPVQVGRFAGANLVAENASDLLERNGELSFAFPFRDGRSVPSDGGAIFLRRRRGGQWSADTLRTVNAPAVLKTTFDRDGSIVVLVGLAEDIPGRSRERIFVARFDSAWTSPRYLVGDGVRPITNPIIARTGTGFIISWNDWHYMNQPSSRLYWARIDNSLHVIHQQRIDSGEATYPHSFVVVDSQFPMWLYHARSVGGAVKLSIALDSVVTTLPPLLTPFRSPIPSTMALSDNRFAVFTQITALKPNEPIAESYMTTLEVRCPKTVRR